jgi:hypothetical protein
MKYKKVEIKQHKDYQFLINIQSIPGERSDEYLEPNPIGFYYVPRDKDSKEAFNELKKCMIDDISKQMKDLYNCFCALDDLEYKEE